jgi:hypothetical protein
MKYIIALNLQSRYARPSVGEFHYSDAHQRHVWKGKEISDIAELSTEINAALNLVQVMDQIDLIVRVFPVKEAEVLPPNEEPAVKVDIQEQGAVEQEQRILPDLNTISQFPSPKRGRPRKLATATP